MLAHYGFVCVRYALSLQIGCCGSRHVYISKHHAHNRQILHTHTQIYVAAERMCFITDTQSPSSVVRVALRCSV